VSIGLALFLIAITWFVPIMASKAAARVCRICRRAAADCNCYRQNATYRLELAALKPPRKSVVKIGGVSPNRGTACTNY
jgi:hypothetical protein